MTEEKKDVSSNQFRYSSIQVTRLDNGFLVQASGEKGIRHPVELYYDLAEAFTAAMNMLDRSECLFDTLKKVTP